MQTLLDVAVPETFSVTVTQSSDRRPDIKDPTDQPRAPNAMTETITTNGVHLGAVCMRATQVQTVVVTVLLPYLVVVVVQSSLLKALTAAIAAVATAATPPTMAVATAGFSTRATSGPGPPET